MSKYFVVVAPDTSKGRFEVLPKTFAPSVYHAIRLAEFEVRREWAELLARDYEVREMYGPSLQPP